MLNTTPVWLLDVDGVINAIGTKPDPSVWPRDTWSHTRVSVTDGSSWPILTASPVIDFLRAAHDSGAVEIRWHTTWQSDAPKVLAPLLGLPDWPVHPCPEFHGAVNAVGGSSVGPGAWWKLPAALRVVHDENRRLIWTDDDLHMESFSRNGLGGLTLGGHPAGSTLLVSPHVRLGLTKKHLTQITEFIGRADLLAG
jgi:hypothetical protein